MRIIALTKNGLTRRGAVALSVVLLVSFLVLEITVIGLLTAYFSSQQGVSRQLSLQAYAAARSGVADALLRLARDPLFVSPLPYSVPVGDALAHVTVVDASGTQIISISSIGQRLSYQTKLTATATVDSLSGAVFLESMSQGVVN